MKTLKAIAGTAGFCWMLFGIGSFISIWGN